MSTTFGEPDEGSLAAGTRRIAERFARIVSTADVQDPGGIIVNTLKNATERFQLWCGSVGAATDPQKKISLEWRLRDAPDIREDVQSLFVDLAEALDDLLAIITGVRENRISEAGTLSADLDGSDPDIARATIDVSSTNEAHDILDVVQTCIKSLLRLSVLIRKASPRDRWQKALQKSANESLDSSFDIRHVGEKFPKLATPESEWLRIRIGKAITQRRQFIRYCRDHKEHMSEQPTTQPATNDPTTAHHLNDKGQFISDGQRDSLPIPGTLTLQPPPTEISTMASTLQVTTLQALGYDDDDAISVVTSVVSSIEETYENGERLFLPSLQSVSGGHDEFECPLCFTLQSHRHPRRWKQHAYSDLKPYVCSKGRGECDLELFSDRNTWFSHEVEHHRHQYACSLCNRPPFDDHARFHAHVQSKHSNIAATHIDDLAKLCKRPLQYIPAIDCPFCDDFEHSLRAGETERGIQNVVDLDVILVPALSFRRHVGRHMEQLALFAMGTSASGTFASRESGSSANSQASRINRPPLDQSLLQDFLEEQESHSWDDLESTSVQDGSSEDKESIASANSAIPKLKSSFAAAAEMKEARKTNAEAHKIKAEETQSEQQEIAMKNNKAELEQPMELRKREEEARWDKAEQHDTDVLPGDAPLDEPMDNKVGPHPQQQDQFHPEDSGENIDPERHELLQLRYQLPEDIWNGEISLHLEDLDRQLIYRGEAFGPDGRLSQLILLDNYFIICAVLDDNGLPAVRYTIDHEPIPIDLLSIFPIDRDIRRTIPFHVNHLGSRSYLFQAPSHDSRDAWYHAILKAKSLRARSNILNNTDPFRLRLIGITNQVYPNTETSSFVLADDTPVDRALKTSKPLPGLTLPYIVSTTTLFYHGKEYMVLATMDGVYISRILEGVLLEPKTAQKLHKDIANWVAVMDDGPFLLLNCREGGLLIYHLDSNSEQAGPLASKPPLQIFEAITFATTWRYRERDLILCCKSDNHYQRSNFAVIDTQTFERIRPSRTSQLSRIFGIKYDTLSSSGPSPVLDKFWLPSSCSGVETFTTTISAATHKGFEVLRLDKKSPWSVPNFKPAHVESIAARVENLRALSMFKISDEEFLCCYDECAVYIDKHGEVSRNYVLDYAGKVHNIAIWGKYLALFHENFVEVRNVQTSRRVQVIEGDHVRLVDDGKRFDKKHRLKIAMRYPDKPTSQILLELCINDGHLYSEGDGLNLATTLDLIV
ncbi:hypothetical protein EJ04DRAFT_555033 [Polyplosphaeria fusca]|uniref:CNH domain-containing protein n=1 Tax=Polyplosphaeria fusca TaxID=682080 RepID=A0A9P4V075_9PLEO|nr:hypothetical protein EJ04DRAFT_555033 [Polyplosphaeria fusca]